MNLSVAAIVPTRDVRRRSCCPLAGLRKKSRGTSINRLCSDVSDVERYSVDRCAVLNRVGGSPGIGSCPPVNLKS
jgi:hypothetical protein